MTQFDLQDLTCTLPADVCHQHPLRRPARSGLRAPEGWVRRDMPPSPCSLPCWPPVPAWPSSPLRRSSPRRGRRPDCERTRPQPAGADGRAVPVPEPLRGPVAEADHYATLYPRRAALPAKCDFAPPEAYPVHAIVAGSSPTLRALDSPAEAAPLQPRMPTALTPRAAVSAIEQRDGLETPSRMLARKFGRPPPDARLPRMSPPPTGNHEPHPRAFVFICG
jgi:hypothetical protein